MSVRLIAVSRPAEDTGFATPEHLISYMARVSNPDNQNNVNTSNKLLKYLINNSHWSPFEMVHMTLEIETTRDISRQILRHRSFSFQEFSQRYAVATKFTTDREARLQDPKNRQNSIVPDNDEVIPLSLAFERMQRDVVDACNSAYQSALDIGIAKEQARALLPEGLTKTTMYMAGSLRSWIHYIDLRSDNGTQKEHREIALECKQIAQEQFPFLKEYWNV